MTNRKLTAIAAATVAFSLSAAEAAEQTFDFDGFDGVSVAAGVHAKIAVGGDFGVRAESSEEGLERLKIRVRDSVLEIGRTSQPFQWRQQDKITVYVTLPSMKALDVSSGSHTEATGVDADGFSLDASSGAHARISGSCNALSIDISSGAHIDADEFECKVVNADASSGGHAKVFASETIVADASTGAHIGVSGSPENVNTDTSTGGDVDIK